MKNPNWLWASLAAVILVIALVFYLKRDGEPEPEVLPIPIAETPPEPEPAAEPEIVHPIEDTRVQIEAPPPEPVPEPEPLPELDDSDAEFKASLADLIGQQPVDEKFHPNGIARRIVATVDNLPRNKVALKIMPVKPVAGRFQVIGEEDFFVISPENYSRYAPYVELVEGMDTDTLAALYVRYYPLLQQAYADLGYPTGYFNDRLVAVIDDLLAAPDLQGPVRLVRPKVMYKFADAELEALSAGQKIMIRMGPENAARIKAKLREIRRVLAPQ